MLRMRQRRYFSRDGPSEAGEFTRDGHDDLVGGQLPGGQPTKARAQACLRLPGDVGHGFGQVTHTACDDGISMGVADPQRVRSILEQGGWSGIEIRPLDIPCAMPEAELERYFTRLGPLGRVIGQVEPPVRDRLIEAVRAAFDRYLHQGEVRFTAACWQIAGRAV